MGELIFLLINAGRCQQKGLVLDETFNPNTVVSTQFSQFCDIALFLFFNINIKK